MSDLSNALNRSATAQNVASGAQVASAAAQAYAAHKMGELAEAQREANELTKLQLLGQQKEKERRARAKELRVACLESNERLKQLEQLISSEVDEKILLKEALFPSVYISRAAQMGEEIFEEFEDLERIRELVAFLKRLDISLGGARVNLLDLPEHVKAYTQPFYKAADDFLSKCEEIETLLKKNNNISLDAPESWADKIPNLEQSAQQLFEETKKMKALGLLVTEEGITEMLAPAQALLAQKGRRPVLDQLKEKNFSIGLPEKSFGILFSSIKTNFDDLTQKTTAAKRNYLALAKQAKIAASVKDRASVKRILEEMAAQEKSFADVEDEVFARKWFNQKWSIWKKIWVGFGVFFVGMIVSAIVDTIIPPLGGWCLLGLLIGVPIWVSRK
ncbi:MAG: hypothetical protein LBE32_03495 [Burkholderiales bacterium]|jgi:hypothetical protein|nr:hypothetical protein [Burkholderiales bacterium]